MSEPPNHREKRLNRWAWLVSIVVFVTVLMMRRIKFDSTVDFSFLPFVYSLLNTVTFFLLLAGFYAIRFRKNIHWHRRFMTIAIGTSALFLLGYIWYHFTSEATSYCGQGYFRLIYFVLLITHIILAALILPFILFTYIRALTGQFDRHKAMAKWVFPIWLYVSISGPIVYLMLRPCYN